MSVLSARDLEFFDENGYVIVRQAVSREQAEETACGLRSAGHPLPERHP